MLEHTFIHLPGIGPKTEQRLWAAGVERWTAFRSPLPVRMGAEKIAAARRRLDTAAAHLAAGDARFFAEALPAGELWRLFARFRDRAVYLDIETNGLDTAGGAITTIALYDGRTVKWYVRGRNLDRFADDIRHYALVVTFNGKCFDVPFIQNDLGIGMDQAHIDLRYVLGSLGYKGGLKGCEKQLGIDRGALDGVDGYFAVLLWDDYVRNGNPKALDTLLAYNIADVLNLEPLMVTAYNRKLAQTPFFRRLHLPDSAPATQNPFQADQASLERIRRKMGWGLASPW